MLDGLVIDWIDGCCPVQGEGTIVGHPWYFRARGRRWTWRVWCDGTSPGSIGLYTCTAEWGDGEFAAGYMPLDVARGIIERSARRFLRRGK